MTPIKISQKQRVEVFCMSWYYNLLVDAGVDAFVASWAVSIVTILVIYFILKSIVHIFE